MPQFTIDMLKECGELVLLKTSCLTRQKKITEEMEAKALSTTGRAAGLKASREIIAKSFMKDVLLARSQARHWLRSNKHFVFEFPMMRSVYFIPGAFIEEARTTMGVFKAHFDTAVEEFCKPENYTAMMQDAFGRLGQVYYDPSDYPTEPRSYFNLEFIEFNITNVGENPMLETVSSFKDNVAEVLRKRMGELLTLASQSLSIDYDDDGNEIKGTIRSDMFQKFEDLLGLVRKIDQRLIGDDKVVTQYVDTLNKLIRDEKGQLLDAKSLRKASADEFRVDLGDKMADLRDSFMRQIEENPIRKIQLDDDDDEE